jgi:outer membrane scaffolding protein for murein synthesis (MipA/OmpV family)
MSRRIALRPAHPAAHRAASFAAIATLAALAAVPGTARAQHTGTSPRPGLTGFAGVAIVALPRYTGSDDYRVLPVPIGQLEYRGRLFLGGVQGGTGPGIGAHLVRTPSLTWDVGLSGAGARPERRGDALAGMGRRSGASFATTAVAYRLAFVQAAAGVAVGLGESQGSYGTVGLGTELPLGRRWVAGVSTGATFADTKHMAFDFGVTPEQSVMRRALLASGDARLRGVGVGAYAPSAGLKETRSGASLRYRLSDRSRVVLFAQSTTLSGAAARSPLVRARTGAVTGAALGYGF